MEIPVSTNTKREGPFWGRATLLGLFGIVQKTVLLAVMLFVIAHLVSGLLKQQTSVRAATTTCNWTDNSGAGDNKWSTATNWDCGFVPNNTYDVVLSSSKNYPLTIDVIAAAASFTVNAGYTQTITANANFVLDIAQGGTGSFTLSAGTYSAGSSSLTVPGSWNSSGGTFMAGTSTVNFTATAAGKTITSGTNVFNNTIFNGTSPGAWTLQDNFTAYSINITGTAKLTDNGKTVTTTGADGSGNSIVIANTASLLSSTGSWVQNATGNISDPQTGNFFAALTMAVSSTTSTMTGDVGAKVLTMGPGALNGGSHNLEVDPRTNDPLTVNSLTVGTALNTFQIICYASFTQKAFTVPNNFGLSYIRNSAGSMTATGDFNYGNNTLRIDDLETASPTKFTDMSASTLTAGSVYLGYSTTYYGILKLGSSQSHSVKSITRLAGNSVADVRLDMGSSKVTLSDNQDFTGVAVTRGTSTLVMNGSGKTLTPASQTLNNLEIAGNTTLGGAVITAGNLTIDGGITFNTGAGNYAATVGGNWANSGVYTGNNSLVTLNGTGAQTVSGSNTFYQLTAGTSSAARTLTFANGTTQTISNALSLTGSAGKMLSLRSDSQTHQWNITPSGSRSVSYVDVQDSNNTISITPVIATNSRDSGNNLNWTISPGVPYMTVQAANPIATVSATLNGDIFDTYGAVASERGFNLYNGGSCGGGVIQNPKEIVGGYSEGIYSQAITSLTSNTQYSYTAYAINVAGTGTSVCQSFTTVAATPAMAAPTATNVASTGATFNGDITDVQGHNATERGFKVYTTGDCSGAAVDNPKSTGTFGAGAYSLPNVVALSPNIAYHYTAYAVNSDGTGTSTCQAFNTLAAVPGAPTVTAASTSSLTVVIALNGNPASTLFAIACDGSGSTWLAANGASCGVGKVYQTYTVWGGGSGVIRTGLSVNTQYTFTIMAMNIDSIETALSSSTARYTLANSPTGPTVDYPTQSTLSISIGSDGNPSNTVYAIFNKTAPAWIKANGSASVGPVWQTVALWNPAGVGQTITGLSAATTYTFQIVAENGDGVWAPTNMNNAPSGSNTTLAAGGRAFYIDFTNGNDANDGSINTPLKYHPWMSDYSGAITLQAGDVVYMKRGEQWIKSNPSAAYMTVAQSGASGNPITTAAYGTGPAPLIKISTSSDYAVIKATGESYVTFDNLHIQHNTSTFSAGSKDGIRLGKNGSTIPHDWIITNNEIDNIPNTAINGLDDAYNITIGNTNATATATTTAYSNLIHDFGYAGVLLSGADPVSGNSNFNVYYNYIHDATQTVTGANEYGIAFSASVSSLNWPKIATARYNYVANITTWEGIETHGGSYLYFLDNYVYNCIRHVMLSATNRAGFPAPVADHQYAQGNILEQPTAAPYSTDSFIHVLGDTGIVLTDSDVSNNTIRFTSRPSAARHYGIRVANSARVTVNNNKLSNGPTVNSNGAIYLEHAGTSVQDITVHGNSVINWGPGITVEPGGVAGTLAITDNIVSSPTYGLYMSVTSENIGNSSTFQFYNNTLFTANTPFYAGATGINLGATLSMKNNIISYTVPTTPNYYIQLNGTLSGTFAVDYNQYFNDTYANPFATAGSTKNWATWQGLSFDTHSIGPNTNPLFVNASGGYSAPADFYLQQASLSVDAGTNVGLTSDYLGDTVPDGVASDIGAIEYLHSGPALGQVTAIATPTTNAMPSYTFSSTQAGTISYGGGCVSGTTNGVVGNNTVTFDVLPDGTYIACTITLTNNASVASTPLTINTFQVDTTPPVSFTPGVTPSAWTSTNSAIITFATTDAGVGLSGYNLKIDNGAYIGSVSSPFSIDTSALSDGIHTFTVKASDTLNNYVEETAQIKIDRTAPTVSAAVSPSSANGTNGYYKTTPTITLSASDASSGLASIQYHWDSVADSTYSSAFTVPNDIHTLSYHAVDNAGNVSATVTQTFNVDSVTPTLSNLNTSEDGSSATFTWNTDEAASTQADIGQTSSYGITTVENDTNPRVTAHSMTLSGLSSCTTYHFRVKSTNIAGNQGVSGDNTFTTTGCIQTSASSGGGSARGSKGKTLSGITSSTPTTSATATMPTTEPSAPAVISQSEATTTPASSQSNSNSGGSPYALVIALIAALVAGGGFFGIYKWRSAKNGATPAFDSGQFR